MCRFYRLQHIKKFLNENKKVVGIDNLNDYYSTKLKKDRLKLLKRNNKKFIFHKFDLLNFRRLDEIIKRNKIRFIIHLAAQAGVRDSIYNPKNTLIIM